MLAILLSETVCKSGSYSNFDLSLAGAGVVYIYGHTSIKEGTCGLCPCRPLPIQLWIISMVCLPKTLLKVFVILPEFSSALKQTSLRGFNLSDLGLLLCCLFGVGTANAGSTQSLLEVFSLLLCFWGEKVETLGGLVL